MMDDLLQEMIDPAPVHHDAPRRRRLWTTVAIVGLAAVGATTLTTSAIFTDNDATSADHRERHRRPGRSATDVPFAFAPQNLAPGDSTFAPLQVHSNGLARAAVLDLRTRADRRRTAAADPDLDPPAVARRPARRPRAQRVRASPQARCTAAAIGDRDAAQRRRRRPPWPATSTHAGRATRPGRRRGDRDLTRGRLRASGSASGSTSRSTGRQRVPGLRGDARPDASTPSRRPTTPEPDDLLVGRATRRPSRRPTRAARDRSAAFSCPEADVAPAPRRRAVDRRRRLRRWRTRRRWPSRCGSRRTSSGSSS